MTKADKIRELARSGSSVVEIAGILGIRYQHAYDVLSRSGMLPSRIPGGVTSKAPRRAESPSNKPPLSVETLRSGGFVSAGSWILSVDGRIELERPLPKEVGAYAFVVKGYAVYVGVATRSLATRFRSYLRPGSTQRTSLRLNTIIRDLLEQGGSVEIFVATPPDLEWNGLPIHASAGLELGLIKRFSLEWNSRSAG